MARTKLIDLYRSLNDKPLHEQEEPKSNGQFKEEKVEIEIPGTEGKQEVKIEHKDVMTDEALKGVTITFSNENDDVEKYTDVDFDAGEMIEDHENEGQDWIFIAEGDGSMTFEVEVQVEASYQESGNIQQIDWETLTVIFSDEGEPLDEADPKGHWNWREKLKRLFGSLSEGTCGYAPDGDIDPYNTDELEPAGGRLFILEDEGELNELKFGCTSNHDCQGGDDDMCCDYNTWSCKPCGMLAPIKKTKNERKNVGRGDKNECEKDSDCSGTYDGLCCHDGACSQCITFEKPPKDSKKLEESVIKRLQKLANIKK